MFKKSTLPKIAHSWRNGLIWKHLDVVCYWEHLLLWKAKYFYTDSEKKSKPRFFYSDTSAKRHGGIKHYIQWSVLHKRMQSQTNININLSRQSGKRSCLFISYFSHSYIFTSWWDADDSCFPIPVFYRGKHLYSWLYKVISPQQVCI